MKNTKCCACDSPLNEENKSSEHIIHNAIGGILKDTSIYCKSCNSKYGTEADKDFTKMFAYIMAHGNIRRDRKTKGSSYNGVAFDSAGTLYNVVLKDTKIINITDVDGNHVDNKQGFYKLHHIEFKLDNEVFKNGLAKIAFNYAIHCGLSPSNLECIYDMESRSIITTPIVIPFFPVTVFDSVIECINDDELYHALRLFNVGKRLYCYVELFSTFQYYLLLSKQYSGFNIDIPYCNIIEKKKCEEDDELLFSLTPNDCKDALIIMEQYSITWDEAEKIAKHKLGLVDNKKIDNINLVFEQIGKLAFESVRKRSYEIEYSKIVERKYEKVDFIQLIRETHSDVEFMQNFYSSFQYYTVYDINETCMNTYKIITPSGKLYPEFCCEKLLQNWNITPYTNQKFDMLNAHLKFS